MSDGIEQGVLTYAADGLECEGFYARPAGTGPFPGVVIAHAWMGAGDFEREQATRLARMGYATLVADVYGAGNRADNATDAAALMQPLVDDRAVLRSRIRAAVDVIHSKDEVDGDRIAATGYCFGGLTVLELARSGAEVAGVVSFHGLLMRDSAVETAKTIPAKVLVLHGYADPMAPPDHVTSLASELTAAGCDWQIHMYGTGMHAFTNPGAQDPENGILFDADLARRSWQSMTDFLSEVC